MVKIQTKVCSTCHKEKSINNFYKKSRTKDGLDTVCIDCNREYQRKRKLQNIKYEPETVGTKICYKCGKEQDINNFCIDTRLVGGRTNRCKLCDKQYHKQYKDKNKDLVANYNKYYNNQIIEKTCIICKHKYKGKRNGTNFCPECHAQKRTLPELDFINLLVQFDIKYEVEYSLGKYNYDFYLPEYNLLVEISPTYTHSINPTGYISKGKDKLYHKNKVHYANEKGYICINIWDWLDKSQILCCLKKSGKLNIVKREIKEYNIDGLTLFDDGQDLEV